MAASGAAAPVDPGAGERVDFEPLESSPDSDEPEADFTAPAADGGVDIDLGAPVPGDDCSRVPAADFVDSAGPPPAATPAIDLITDAGGTGNADRDNI